GSRVRGGGDGARDLIANSLARLRASSPPRARSVVTRLVTRATNWQREEAPPCRNATEHDTRALSLTSGVTPALDLAEPIGRHASCSHRRARKVGPAMLQAKTNPGSVVALIDGRRAKRMRARRHRIADLKIDEIRARLFHFALGEAEA